MKNNNTPIYIIISNETFLLRHGLEKLIEEDESLKVIFKANGGSQALEFLEQAEQLPDVIILTCDFRTCKIIRQRYPQIKIIFFGDEITTEFALRVIRSEVCTYISLSTSPDEVRKAIKNVYQKGFHFNNYITGQLITQMVQKRQNEKEIGEQYGLTPREVEYANYTYRQMSNSEIAMQMNISQNTARTYRQKIMQKIGATKSAGIILFASAFNESG